MLSVTIRWTLSRWCSSMIGPSATCSVAGLPTGVCSACAARTSMYWSAMLCATRCRPVVMQTWPWCMNEPNAPTETAFSTSTSSSTIIALLPPSSRCTRLRCFAASWPTARPPRDEPVNEIMWTPGSATSASPVVHAARENGEEPIREARLLEDAGEHDTAGNRGPGVRFEEHGVAERERRGDGADRQDQREVERRDHPDHADGEAARQAQDGVPGPQEFAVRLRRQAGGLEARAGREPDLQVGLRGDRARLAHDPALDAPRR